MANTKPWPETAMVASHGPEANARRRATLRAYRMHCNTLLGCARDSIPVLVAAISYLNREDR